MKEKLNIIQFMPYFPPHKGWLETVWKEIWKYWVKNDFGSFINIVTAFEQNQEVEKNKKIIFNDRTIWYKKEGYEVLVCPSLELINNFPVFKVWSNEYKLIEKYLNTKVWKGKKNFRVITHTRFFITSFIWWLFAKKNNIKWVHIEHWSNYVKLSSKIKTNLSIIYDKTFWKWIFKKTDIILAISQACKNFIKNEFLGREVNVFYRGIELKEKKNSKQWEIKLVFIWRLVKLKWVDYLLEVFEKLSIKNKLIIIWDWEEKENLKKFIKNDNIKNIEFSGFKNKDFIEKFLSENNCILINSSFQEWLPTTVIEWLFYKNVVIASNVWWTNEISNKEDLILFEAWNKKELREQINFAIKNYDKIVWKSEKIVKENFSWERNILKLYNFVK